MAFTACKLLGVQMFAASTHYLHGNAGVWKRTHTITQTVAMIINKWSEDSDVHLPHATFAYNNSVFA